MSNGPVLPEWIDRLRPLAGVVLLVVPVYLVVIVYYGASPRTLNLGYRPTQPVPFSHALHAGELGIDCRYCHTTVEEAAHAAIPPTKTCMNCHDKIQAESPRLVRVRESAASGDPIPWIRVHDLPDFVYFDHSAHVARGVSCVSCHGRVDQMEVVEQVETLSMAWCLDCHRNPEPHLRPQEFVTRLDWDPHDHFSPAEAATLGADLRRQFNIHPPTDCSTCHR